MDKLAKGEVNNENKTNLWDDPPLPTEFPNICRWVRIKQVWEMQVQPDLSSSLLRIQ